MDDFNDKIKEILSSPGAMDSIRGLAGMLGQQQTQSPPPAQDTAAPPSSGQNSNMPDLSALLSQLTQQQSGQNAAPSSGQNSNMPDLSALLSQLTQQQPGQNAAPSSGQNSNMPDLSALLSQLTQQQSGQNAAPNLGGLGALSTLGNLGGLGGLGGAGGGISQEMMLKLIPLISTMNQEDERTKLLVALRPHLKPERRKKLDEAAQLLKLTRLLPLFQEQGIFKSLL